MNDNPRQNKDPELVKTRWGFYQYSPLPTDEELSKYYTEKYYQLGKGSYSVSYSNEEIEYFQLKARLIYRKYRHLMPKGEVGQMLDVGCGEGWTLNAFLQNGHQVLGLDYSRYSIEKFHPHLMPHFIPGDLYASLAELIRAKRNFDVIVLANVIEHVKDPIQLLKDIQKIMSPGAKLIIVAPNDFSALHSQLIEQKRISRRFWLCYPDHLSYFNKESMVALLDDIGFSIHCVVADNPVDLNLLNDSTNYIDDPALGKQIHMYRVRSDNFLAGRDEEKLLQIYELMGAMGVGRDLSYFCSMAK